MGIRLETLGDKFELLECYEIKGYIIPKGFVTDFATMPRWTLSLMGRPTRGQYQRASLLHDYLLKEKLVERKVADKKFYELLLEDGANEQKAYIMYLAVSFFRVIKKLGLAKKP